MKGGIEYFLGVLGFLFAIFIFWYSGVDFNSRGPLQAVYFAMSIIFGFSVGFTCATYDE